MNTSNTRWFEELKVTFSKNRELNCEQNQVKQQSAVCLILRHSEVNDSPEILFIKRSERADDPWSGHMAFPGGRRHAEDKRIEETAIREVYEEIGLKLQQHELLGALPAYSPRVSPDLAVYPFVYLLSSASELQRDPSEVDELHWISLKSTFQKSSFIQRPYSFRGMTMTLPSFSLYAGIKKLPETEQRFVWGVTYVLLLDFLRCFVQTNLGQSWAQNVEVQVDELWQYRPYR